MAKDPRFAFYPDNWEGGTEGFSLEQEGAYLALIIMQSRKGRFTKEQALDKLLQKTRGDAAACAGLWNFLMPKFCTDGKLYWSERLEKEVFKAVAHSKKQSDRAKTRWDKTGIDSQNAAAYTPRMPVNGRGIGIGSGIEKEGGLEETINLEAELEIAFDERYMTELAMAKAYPGVDLDAALIQFLVKVRGSPGDYTSHLVAGLRKAFNHQLRHSKPQKNGQHQKPNITGTEIVVPGKDFGAEQGFSRR